MAGSFCSFPKVGNIHEENAMEMAGAKHENPKLYNQNVDGWQNGDHLAVGSGKVSSLSMSVLQSN